MRRTSGFYSMLKDKVSLLKANGEKIDNIKALVQPDMIFSSDTSIPIVEGDQFLRLLPNGTEEKYTVIDSGFQSEFGSMEAHYQTKVRKETGLPEKQKFPVQNIGMFVQGNAHNNSIQAVGVSNEKVSQTVNDPKLLQTQIEKAIKELIEVVKPEVNTSELINYINLTEELKQLLLSDKKEEESSSLFKGLISSLSLLDSANGTLDLVYKIWPYLLPLIAFGSEIYAKMH